MSHVTRPVSVGGGESEVSLVRVDSQDSAETARAFLCVLVHYQSLLDGAAAAVQLQQHERARNRLSGVVSDHLTATWNFEEN
jgi:hypothetical protein